MPIDDSLSYERLDTHTWGCPIERIQYISRGRRSDGYSYGYSYGYGYGYGRG